MTSSDGGVNSFEQNQQVRNFPKKIFWASGLLTRLAVFLSDFKQNKKQKMQNKRIFLHGRMESKSRPSRQIRKRRKRKRSRDRARSKTPDRAQSRSERAEKFNRSTFKATRFNKFRCKWSTRTERPS